MSPTAPNGFLHRRSISMRDCEPGRDESARALLQDEEDDYLPDPDDYHRISLQSLERDPLEPLPRTSSLAYKPPQSLTTFLTPFTTRIWARRKSDASDWRLSGETLIGSWQEKTTKAPLYDGYFLHYLRRFLLFLLPSFLQARYYPTEADLQPRKSHSTGYLDGLRGLAALFVFFFHCTNNVYDQVKYTYGSPLEEDDIAKGYGPNNNLLQLPIIRVLYAGPFAVSIFFIVSGFALSLKPIKQMRAHDHSGLLTTLQSAVFRRPLRLFLPCFISTFVALIVGRLGMFKATLFIAENSQILTGRSKFTLYHLDSFSAQFYDWFWTAVGMVKFFTWTHDEFQEFFSLYDTHLWTIPIELRASLALFLTHLALARFRPGIRLGMVVFACFWSIHEDRWEMLLFWGGYVLAELNQGVLAPTKKFAHQGLQRLLQCFLVANFVSGLYLASYPDAKGEEAPGYIFLTTLVPEAYQQKRRFWQGIGGLQIVLAVSSLPSLSRFFSSAIPHYLGQISYALYLVHAMVNHTIGYWLFYAAYLATGGWASEGWKKVGFTVALVLDTIVAIWAADMFWRFGDRPMVSFAKWVEDICLSKI